MSGWALATEVAVWILIVGSSVVFLWFLAEVARLAGRGSRRRKAEPGGPDAPAEGGPRGDHLDQ